MVTIAPARTSVDGKRPLRSRQNTSDAVMAQRGEQKDNLDDFPTPPWGTRALCGYVIGQSGSTCLEPAAGRGYMSATLAEYFGSVTAMDIASDYGYPLDKVENFVGATWPYPAKSFDWVITNPPFKLAKAFVKRSLSISRIGCAVLCRTVFLESVGRYNDLFRDTPPWRFAPFVERLPMVEGRVDEDASSATSYSWFVWLHGNTNPCETLWIPPCRARLERVDDYKVLPREWII